MEIYKKHLYLIFIPSPLYKALKTFVNSYVVGQ